MKQIEEYSNGLDVTDKSYEFDYQSYFRDLAHHIIDTNLINKEIKSVSISTTQVTIDIK